MRKVAIARDSVDAGLTDGEHRLAELNVAAPLRTHDEVARLLHCSKSTVKADEKRALVKMREALAVFASGV